jgi:hypothetical protein
VSGRNTTANFNAALVGPVTGVGYLLQIDGIPGGVLRYCDIGNEDYATFLWSEMDFTVSGLSFDADKPLGQRATLKISNHDGGFAGLLQTVATVRDIAITVRQFARGATDDAPHLVTCGVGGIDVAPDYVTIHLLPTASGYTMAPRKRVTPDNGFNWATPAGTVLQWGNQVFELGERNG